MTKDALEEAMKLAQEFIKTGEAVLAKHGQAWETKRYYTATGAETAAAKRKSMDLTHALTKFRKS